MANADPLLTLPQASAYAAVSVSTLRRHYTKPDSDPARLQVLRHFGHIKVRQSWLDDWIERTAGDT